MINAVGQTTQICIVEVSSTRDFTVSSAGWYLNQALSNVELPCSDVTRTERLGYFILLSEGLINCSVLCEATSFLCYGYTLWPAEEDDFGYQF